MNTIDIVLLPCTGKLGIFRKHIRAVYHVCTMILKKKDLAILIAKYERKETRQH
jgi:hypothetical protein